MDATAKRTTEPHRPCRFAVGDLVTCAGPFNSGRDERGYWRQVERVEAVRWEPPFYGFKGRLLGGLWRVAISGFSGPDIDLSSAPEGTRVGDIIRLN